MNAEELEQVKRLLPCYTPMEQAPEGLSLEEQRAMYYDMRLIREFEFKVRDLWRQNLIQGMCHAYYYAEAIAVGACHALEKGDYITSTHRGHGHALARGASPDRMMAELLGKQEGYNRGKGGSMHIADVESGMLGATGIVGSGIGPATGAGLSAKLLKNGKVSLCFFGDGGSNQGIFTESMNMAAAWSLPVIFLCENNQWAIGTDYHRVTAQHDVYLRAQGYGLPGVQVDGFNPFEVYKAVRTAADRARAGQGPTLIEARFLRLLGHHVGDDQLYRELGGTEPLYLAEPVARMGQYLLDKGMTAQELEALDQSARDAVEKAVDFAQNSCTEPPLEELYRDIYANEELIV